VTVVLLLSRSFPAAAHVRTFAVTSAGRRAWAWRVDWALVIVEWLDWEAKALANKMSDLEFVVDLWERGPVGLTCAL